MDLGSRGRWLVLGLLLCTGSRCGGRALPEQSQHVNLPCEDRESNLAVGETCECEGECATGLCWVLPQWLATVKTGSICSALCLQDTECVKEALSTGASRAAEARCSIDGRCWIPPKGWGSS